MQRVRRLRRSTGVTCSAWSRSAGRHRRHSCTGCSACTVRPRDAHAPGHSGRFHPGSSGRRILGSSGNASRPAPSRRSSTSSATSPDFPPERDDAPSFPPCRRSFALPSPLAVHRAVAPRWNPYRRASSDHHSRSASPRHRSRVTREAGGTPGRRQRVIALGGAPLLSSCPQRQSTSTPCVRR